MLNLLKFPAKNNLEIYYVVCLVWRVDEHIVKLQSIVWDGLARTYENKLVNKVKYWRVNEYNGIGC